MQQEIWSLGAESTIFRVKKWGQVLALKWRSPKPYLLREIDETLRVARTSRECKMLDFARKAGVPTPSVHTLDMKNMTILMDFIEGSQLKQVISKISNKRLRTFCLDFGRMIALLHRKDVVHGDPTTSNLIVDDTMRMWMIDFGLAEWNATDEMKGVDLHLIRRALETTHWEFQDTMLEATLKGYSKTLGDEAESIIKKMEEIRERGRYH